jgi:hypothetical protein
LGVRVLAIGSGVHVHRNGIHRLMARRAEAIRKQSISELGRKGAA